MWTLSTPQSDRWLASVARHQTETFADVAHVRVGIKSTADAVFIRQDWQELEPEHQPECTVVHPLITHHDAGRWSMSMSTTGTGTGDDEAATRKSVLYPHVTRDGRRMAIDLSKFPRAAAYLSLHRERLEGRRYVIEGGRKWYEIWVPHDPSDWAKPKVVFPDIAEHPTFFWDDSGAIVNGDCYWITLKDDVPKDWLYLILAIGNSSFITQFYDHLFFNKLYAGRRRFMTQYVKQFPLPDLESPVARKIVSLTKKAVRAKRQASRAKFETQIDALVSEAFGVG